MIILGHEMTMVSLNLKPMVQGWSKDGPRILDKESEFQNRLDLLSHDIRYFREQNQDSDHLQSQITII